MIRVKVKTKVDTKPFRKLVKDVNSRVVNVGYIDSPEHWNNSGLSVADLAAILHFDSDWSLGSPEDGFMLDEQNKGVSQVKAILNEYSPLVGHFSIREILDSVGKEGADAIRFNIMSASTPPNSEDWEKRKGFNDPLVHGGRTGDEPNLLSEVTHRVVKIK